MPNSTSSYRFRPDWKTTAFVAFFLPVLLSLGVWQLQREQEKIEILDSHHQRMAQPAVDLGASWPELLGKDSAYRRVLVAGRFLPDPIILLDNKINAGVVGYQVIQAFELTTDNEALGVKRLAWVNRGWVTAGRLRTDLPSIETPEQAVRIQAHIYQSLGKAFVLNEPQEGERVLSEMPNGPIIAQQFEPGSARHFQRTNGLNSGMQTNYFPHLLRLEAGSVAAYAIDWPAVNTRPEKHQAYAIQWFAMALALIIFYLIRSRDPVTTIDDSTEREPVDEQ